MRSSSGRRATVAVCAALALAAAAIAAQPALAGKGRLKVSVQSSRPNLVTGGNALIQVDVPARVRLSHVLARRNGRDVRGALKAAGPHRLLGVVAGLRPGENRISARIAGRAPVTLNLFDSDIRGPILSGPHQSPFYCRTQANGLGAPGDNCSAPTAVTYRYRSTGGGFKTLASPTSRPADLAQTTTSTGQTVDYVVRIESGVINRSIYRWAVLASGGVTGRGWNDRLVFSFGGGCSTGYQQGDVSLNSVLDDRQLSRGYSVITSSLTQFATACNDVLSAETASMVKEHVIESLGRPPVWTIGDGGSGGSIQAQMIAQNYPGILDGLLPTASFPDNSQPTQPDCALLDAYFGTPTGSALSDAQREAITGLSVPNGCHAFAGAKVVDASTGCDESVIPSALIFDPLTNPDGLRCSLWDTMINVYGTDPSTGKARRALDNVGVQYGLDALRDGAIGVDEFLDLNELIGGFDDDGQMVPERAVADPAALATAYRTGRLNRGGGGMAGVPIVDTRNYADDQVNVHQYVNTYITRARLRRTNGTSANQVMLRSTGGGVAEMRDAALDTLADWLDRIEADGSSRSLPKKVIADRPADAVDACWTSGGVRIEDPAEIGGTGPCTTMFPPHSLPRNEAGKPLDSLVAKCRLKVPDPGDYPAMSQAQWSRLAAIFPGGVCDWTQPGVEEQPLTGTWISFGPARVVKPRRRFLGLRARPAAGRRRIALIAWLRPCPEVRWQRVIFERRLGRRWRRLGARFVDRGCRATLRIRGGRRALIRVRSPGGTGYRAAAPKRRRLRG